ncbi:MAG: winged helix-turn-helix transcriptional regulator [Pararhodobacter sp.]
MDSTASDTAANARQMLEAMERGDVLAPDCPSRPVLQHLTSRWGVLVMAVLATGTYRFAALRRRIGGVSERMLAQTLQQLEADGFVHRHDFGEVPPRVEYSLTPLGIEAARHVVALVSWIEGNIATILQAQTVRQSLRPSADRNVPASA